MRRIAVILLVVALGWTGYWFAARMAILAALSQAGAAPPEAQQAMMFDRASLTGFPGQFDLALDGLTWGRSGEAVADIPQLRIAAESYRPNHIEATLPGPAVLTLPDQAVRLVPGRLGASLTVAPAPMLPVEDATLTGDTLALSSSQGWKATISALAGALRAAGPDGHYRLTLDMARLVPGPGLRALIDPKAAMPPAIGPFALDAGLGFRPAPGLIAGEVPPRLEELDLARASLTWGTLVASATGRLTVSAAGWPEGEVKVTLVHWRRALELAQDARLITPDEAGTLSRALSGLAEGTADPETVTLPLSLSGGWLRFGFVPLAPLPRLAPPQRQ